MREMIGIYTYNPGSRDQVLQETSDNSLGRNFDLRVKGVCSSSHYLLPMGLDKFQDEENSFSVTFRGTIPKQNR